MRKHLTFVISALSLIIGANVASAEQTRVLWWDGSPTYKGATNARDREKMARYIGSFNGGSDYAVTFQHSTRGDDFARRMSGSTYDIIVVDVTTESAHFSRSDLDAFRRFYQSGHKALMLDGTLWIRNARPDVETKFPGPNGAGAALLMNQIKSMEQAGGGLIIGTDHREFQVGANQVLKALVPQARFTGRTDPSRNGVFFGNALLNTAVPARPLDILRHWEAIPSQAETPIGQYIDFLGNPVRLYSLVETADKPGNGSKRPYISATFNPGTDVTAIDSNTEPEPEPIRQIMPTRKSPPLN